MIAGEVISFVGNNNDPEVSRPTLIELTDWSGEPFIELAADVGKRRVYFKFRMDDLEKWCARSNVPFFRGRTGIWTTLDALNAALGVRPSAAEPPRRKLEF